MRKRLRIRIILSLIFAMAAGYLTYNYLGGLEKDISIVVVSKDVKQNEMLNHNNLKLMSIDVDERDKYFPNSVANISEVSGSISRLALKAGTPVIKEPEALLYGEEKTLALNYDGSVDGAYFIPSDKRVIAVETDGVGAIGSQLKRGDYVDIIYTANDEMGSGMFSNMILQHIQIYDVKTTSVTDLGPNAGSKVQILLMASPEESLELTMAKRTGVLDFVLNPLEGETLGIEPIHVSHLSTSPVMTNGEIIDYLAGEIINEEVITESAKLEILQVLESEKSIDRISKMIESSSMNSMDKQKTLTALRGRSNDSLSVLDEISVVVETVESSWLEDEEKVRVLSAIDKEVNSITQTQKQNDIEMIMTQVKTSHLSDDVKEAIIEALKSSETDPFVVPTEEVDNQGGDNT